MLVKIRFVRKRGIGNIIAVGQALVTSHTFEVVYGMVN